MALITGVMTDYAATFGQGGLNDRVDADALLGDIGLDAEAIAAMVDQAREDAQDVAEETEAVAASTEEQAASVQEIQDSVGRLHGSEVK